MSRQLALFLLCSVPGLVLDASGPLTGQFTHNFTRPENQSVWTVTKTGITWKVLVHGSNQILRAKEVGEEKKEEFWEKMWWPTEEARNAQCLTFEDNLERIMCYVPRSSRAELSELSKNASDYFYFDQMGGLMEIRRKSK